MRKKSYTVILLSIFLVSILVPTISSNPGPEDIEWWDQNWSFRQLINVSIDTSKEEAIFQPIDIKIEFKDSCWAINEEDNSIMIVVYKNGIHKVIERQIYNLEFSDESHIKSCGLVFLIPDFANGEEYYFIYYDDSEKLKFKMDDYVVLEESFYEYSLAEGIGLSATYYQIRDMGDIIYTVAQEGTGWDNHLSQQVAKLQPGTKEIKPNSPQHTCSFALIYWWHENGEWTHISTSEKLISKEILIDGNLMVKFAIKSRSKGDEFETIGYYKYYHSPNENKKIHASIEHKINKYNIKTGDEINLAIISVALGGVKSSTIKELNFGEIPKYLHFYSDEERVVQFPLDQNPECIEWQQLIDKEDDYDLGSFPWLSADFGETGEAQAVIFDSTNILEDVTDEPDGIELQMFHCNNIRLPGLDGISNYLYIMRNAYEKGQERDEIIPEDYNVKFNAEFYSTQNGGYVGVEKEAKIYQELISSHPENEEDISDGDEIKKRYNVTAYLHIPRSVFRKILTSAILLKNSYISVELFSENISQAYERSGRIAFTEDQWIDFENISIFKKACFTQPEGKYFIKVWLENAIFQKEKELIGFKFVELNQDIDTHIFCKPEGEIQISTFNQNNDSLDNVEIILLKDGKVITKQSSDSEGKIIIGAPSGIGEKYTIKTMYKGFLINEEEINLGLLRRFIPLKKSVNINVYNLEVNILNSQDKTPDFDVYFELNSSKMKENIKIKPDETTNGKYLFKNLYPADYNLNIQYNLFDINEEIKIAKDETYSIKLYDFNFKIKDKWDMAPEAELDVTISSNDFNNNLILVGEKVSSSEYKFSNLYEGDYLLRILYKNYKMEENVKIPNGETTIVFPALFNVNITVFDTHGSPLKNSQVIIKRTNNEKEKEIQDVTNENGFVSFSIPPGFYTCSIKYNDELVAQRKLEVLNQKEISIVTNNEPIVPYIIIAMTIIVLIGVFIHSFKRKKYSLFVKILVISLIVIALISPWWSLSGSSADPHLETNTNLFIIPTQMPSITNNDNLFAGELSTLEDEFTDVVELFPILLMLSIICILASVFINYYYQKKKISFFLLFSSLVLIIATIIVFTFAMSILAEVTVGNFIGSGNLDVSIPGETSFEVLSCSWGPSISYYLILIGIIVLLGQVLLNFKKLFFNNKHC